MVHTSKPPKLSADLLLKWGELEAFGRVWWISDTLAGIHFEDPIPQTWILAARNMHDSMEWAKQQAEDWIAETNWVCGKAF